MVNAFIVWLEGNCRVAMKKNNFIAIFSYGILLMESEKSDIIRNREKY